MSSLLGPALRMVVALGVVLALMYVAARLLQRTHGSSPLRSGASATPNARRPRPMAGIRGVAGAWAARRAVGAGGERGSRRPARRRQHRLEVLARQPLSKSASVAVVRVGGRTLLVGVTESSVQLLGDVDAAAFAEDEITPELTHSSIDAMPRGSIDAVTIPDHELDPMSLPMRSANRSTVSVMDVLRERTVRRA